MIRKTKGSRVRKKEESVKLAVAKNQVTKSFIMIQAKLKNLIALQFSSLSFKFLFPKLGSKAENWMSMENLVSLGDESENWACQMSPGSQDLTSPREGSLVRNLGAANQTGQLQKFQVKKKGALHL